MDLLSARFGSLRFALAFLVGAALVGTALPVQAQATRIRDLTISGGEVPVRLVGYGLVVGLEGTGDRVFGGILGGVTVRTVANLLRNLGIEVPERVIRTRNAAAVLVTAEASPYTRRGGRFDVSIASMGDASSLRGGQLWQAPLLGSVGGPPVAVAQGNVVIPASGRNRLDAPVETSAVLTDAAVALTDFVGGGEGPPDRLLMRDPDLATAQRIADAVNAALGEGVATVQDPGAIGLQLPADDPMASLVALGELEVTPDADARVVVDAQSGAVAAGGDISVGEAVVSHDWLTLTIAPPDAPPAAAGGANGDVPPEAPPAPGAIRAEPGVRVQALAAALHEVGATAEMIGAVFRSLRNVGAIRAEVVVR